jgi:energy-converting hydrogenase Eha subunit B
VVVTGESHGYHGWIAAVAMTIIILKIKSIQLMEIFFSMNGFVLIRVVCSVFSHKKPEPLGKSS